LVQQQRAPLFADMSRLPGLPAPRVTSSTCSVKPETGELYNCQARR
jgi:hypothetical protein